MYHIRNNTKNKGMISSKIKDSEAVVSLTDLFYEKKANSSIGEASEIVRVKNRYDNFKLLTDINSVLKKCKHLTDNDKLMYCQSQRYFMKLYLREINKRE